MEWSQASAKQTDYSMERLSVCLCSKPFLFFFSSLDEYFCSKRSEVHQNPSMSPWTLTDYHFLISLYSDAPVLGPFRLLFKYFKWNISFICPDKMRVHRNKRRKMDSGINRSHLNRAPQRRSDLSDLFLAPRIWHLDVFPLVQKAQDRIHTFTFFRDSE